MHARIAIIGAGFGGLGAAIRLRQRGHDDVVVFERAEDLGGTWRDNAYPGCACDVPSHVYSFSFALNPTWSSTYSPQPEIWDYLRRCADRFGVRPAIRFGTDVRQASWDGAAGHWRIETSRGDWTADVLISAGGPLNEPVIPKLPGLETFRGETFHSSRWNHDLDLTGRRVAVIGTGASAIQFVPAIQPVVGRLTLFQRTAAWVMPRRERPLRRWEHAVYRRVPGAQRLMRTLVYWGIESTVIGFLRPRVMRLAQRVALRHLRTAVTDPALRARLTPSYAMGCKRVLKSDTYYPALTRDNVDVVTEAIAEVRPHGIVTRDGVEHEADTIVFGTGFRVTDLPIAERIRGRDGRSLAEVWQGSPRAYRGTTVAGFPNLFLLLGPNTGLGHNSVVLMIEAQLDYVLGALEHLRRTGARSVAPREAAQRAFVAAVDRRMAATVWATGGCSSWYIDATGRNSTLWPGSTWRFRQRMQRFDVDAYEVTA
ncbi:NAD(P)/FAD-dependent oxidoreductase [Dactylosporangium aurantiacum]|uniref:NAD(P)/FAD-dependent oxidoreductase n=1 Tax=Dactylosporangium aurantiacum TaxID=35754 RepID=A0A9Q9IEU9_9ACTN|nr:NAD(P)/FAD-dependent oxidoreductase [Dactylosporangium aurantiacum]MDG6102757.1 NAD(P)/FAD-dependent oxidoreductase [Dactylosporangium aurantiacum]UWZ53000.1 NAD(P)/FAD-dependent oxidoreductase [Dactylosporangium aurantiacum]